MMAFLEKAKPSPPMPTAEELARARQVYEANEPRGVFYHAAMELLPLAREGKSALSVAEVVGMLLQTWNFANYQHGRRFDRKHLSQIEALLAEHAEAVGTLRGTHLVEVRESDLATAIKVFAAFETVLGPVGAAKCLHLLAPDLFPIWDRDIATGYHLRLGGRGSKAEKYRSFMAITAEQCRHLGPEAFAGRNPLKALDEYNYCRFTKKWI